MGGRKDIGKKEIMIITIQQPEHLPWVGFFNKMAQCDLHVYLDNVQFKKRYFENRNRIKTKNGIQWFTVPVSSKGRYTQKINQVVIDNQSHWTKKYMGLLTHTYKKSPFWEDAKNIVFPCIEESENKLLDLNLALIEQCRNYLQIKTPTVLASSLNVDQFRGCNLILQLCLKTKTDTYISGPDGRNYLILNKFRSKEIKIAYHDFKHPVYPQLFGDFVSHMSIIDLIANCGPKSSKIVKNCYRINFKNEN